jgi:malonyl-CoA O-methyltransferase
MTERVSVRRAFSRAAPRYSERASLQRQVGDRLIDALPSAVQASRVLDLGCGTGFAGPALRARFPLALLCSTDFSQAMLGLHRPGDRDVRVCADAHALPFAPSAFDLVFSSLMLQWCDLPRALAECVRVLTADGWLCFSTVLQGSLREIDAAFSGVDGHRHVVDFPAASALHSMLEMQGFSIEWAECATRVEYFAHAAELLQSNRGIGASRVPAGGRPSMLGRAALGEVCRRLELGRTAQGVPLSYELAWMVARPVPGARG